MPKLKKIIEPKYALFFIFRFVIILFVGVGIFSSLIIIFLNRKVGPTYLEGISTLNQLQSYLPKILFITALVQALSLSLIALLLTLFWSHSIAGPVFRFRRHLKDIAQGKLLKEPLAFRNVDQLHGLAGAFSEMVISHEDNNARALALLVEAQKLLDECQELKKEGKGEPEEFNLKLRELKKIYLRIKEIYTPRKSD